MTSIDFRNMLKQAKKEKANARHATDSLSQASKKPQENTMDLASVSPASSVSSAQYRVDTYQYNLDNEVSRFHEMFSEFAVGDIPYVYYRPDYVDEATDALLLQKVRKRILYIH